MPPDGRYVLLSKFEEDLIIGENRFCLSTNQYGGAVFPQGYRYIQKFTHDPFPVWTFKVEGIEFEKTKDGIQTNLWRYGLRIFI
jgi:glycogen debranching enzyme